VFYFYSLSFQHVVNLALCDFPDLIKFC